MTGTAGVLFVAQAVLFLAAGASLLALAFVDFFAHKSATAALLLLWIVGTFTFVCIACWQMSGRYLLPLLPAVSILLVRRLEFRELLPAGEEIGPLFLPLAFSLVIALLVARADLNWPFRARRRRAHSTTGVQDLADGLVRGPLGISILHGAAGRNAGYFWHLSLATNDAVVLPLGNSRHL